MELKRRLIRRPAPLCVLYLFISATAFANYDGDCMKLLEKTGGQAIAFQQFRGEWEPLWRQNLGFARPLTDLEYETFMDLSHGLPLVATFGNKKVAVYTSGKDLVKFAQGLKHGDIVSIKYRPESLALLGRIYKRACEVLGRPGCEYYDKYEGVSSPASRPFTPLEEQALKWSTLHMVPYKNKGSNLKEARQRSAMAILATTFSPDDGARLYGWFVSPFIADAFKRLF
jgi:hypothetical protein